MAESYLGENTGKLGFGMMRLPKKGLGFDHKQVCEMVDRFMEAGFTYFDTAFVYTGSEEATRKALVERYPRERFTIATKLNAGIAGINEKKAKQQFYTSLERTGAGYIDYYLLHAFMDNNYDKYERFKLWDFVREQKEKGLIKHYGFSFHSGPELLERALTEHPDAEFVQLQINYADWENAGVASRANYEIARKHGKPIIVMEPVKGGNLANPPKKVQELFKSYAPDASFASWAIRFVASLPGILTVLSGMSTIGQMEDNLSFMKDFKPLNAEEQKIIQEAQRIMGASKTVPCTSCHYCTEVCPQQIQIPDIFTAMNLQLGNGLKEEAVSAYANVTQPGAMASDCIACGQCEQVCPQHIDIIDRLKEGAALLEAS